MPAIDQQPVDTVHDALVRVHHEWDGWRTAEVRLRDLQEIHWLQPHGAPHPLLHAYVSAEILAGTTLHAPGQASALLRQRVCILKRHAVAGVYASLAQRADDRHAAVSQTVPPSGTIIGRFVKAVTGRSSSR